MKLSALVIMNSVAIVLVAIAMIIRIAGSSRKNDEVQKIEVIKPIEIKYEVKFKREKVEKSHLDAPRLSQFKDKEKWLDALQKYYEEE